ncbi:hypothetical protein WJU22_24520 [Chitinophaga caseinilytica]|uniref:Uncharacterized protein n=1 Tax=Chitinophaga caseinilytica TaxID=2267521 RepID=A0ABZ2Z1A6_9BACT
MQQQVESGRGPPLVYTPRSSVTTTSASTITSGNMRDSASTAVTCVVALRWSSKPVAASIKAPVQKLATSAPFAACWRTHGMNAEFSRK